MQVHPKVAQPHDIEGDNTDKIFILGYENKSVIHA